MSNLTRKEIETALDGHKLFIRMNGKNKDGSDKYWITRRSGATKLWKKDPNRFYISIKYGFKNFDYIDQNRLAEFGTYYKIETEETTS